MNPNTWTTFAQVLAFLTGAVGLAFLVQLVKLLGVPDQYIPAVAHGLAILAAVTVPLVKILAAHQTVTAAMWITALTTAIALGFASGGVYGHTFKRIGRKPTWPFNRPVLAAGVSWLGPNAWKYEPGSASIPADPADRTDEVNAKLHEMYSSQGEPEVAPPDEPVLSQKDKVFNPIGGPVLSTPEPVQPPDEPDPMRLKARPATKPKPTEPPEGKPPTT